jgi:hypothetical protein
MKYISEELKLGHVHPFSYSIILLASNVVLYDQKLASDSSGLSGGFSGQRAWVRKIEKWAPGSYCFELVVKLVQLPGQVLSAPLHFEDSTATTNKLSPFLN